TASSTRSSPSTSGQGAEGLRPDSRIGCSGWQYQSWRDVFYPPRTPQSRLLDMERGVERLYEPLQPLVDAGMLGPVLWQLPERFHRDDERLASALERLSGLPPGRHAFEFRHASWFVPEVEALLRAHGAALVIGDAPERPFQSHALTADWTLVRFHRGARGRRGNYSEAELREWAVRMRRGSHDVDVYAYFNNDWEGFAPRN